MLRMSAVVWVSLLAVSASPAPATEDAIAMPLADATLLQPHNVTVKAVRYGEGFRTPAANERRAVTGRRPEASQERTRG